MAELPVPVPPLVAQWVAEHHGDLYRYAYRLTGSATDAEDLAQQTFLAVMANAEQLPAVKSPKSWLYTILRNCYLKSRQRRRPITASSLELNIDQIPDVQRDELPIDRERLQGALNELADEFKLVLMLFYFEGCSYTEIAQQLDLPIGTVMSRLSRAKGHLRAKLFEPSMPRTT